MTYLNHSYYLPESTDSDVVRFKKFGSVVVDPLEWCVMTPAFLNSLRRLLKQSNNFPFAAFFNVGPSRYVT